MLQPLIEESRHGLALIQQHDLPLLQQNLDWQTKYRLLMQLGKKLPVLPDSLRQDQFLLQGCDSKTWLLHHLEPLAQRHYFMVDSEARIVKGLCAVLLSLVNGKTSTELAAMSYQNQFEALRIRQHISHSRGNGLNQLFLQLEKLTSPSSVQR